MHNIYLIMALIGGAMFPLQAVLNARLASEIASPIFAAFISFATGTLVLGLYFVTTRSPAPSISQLSQLPIWLFAGGLIGAFLVAVSTIVVPRIGAAALISLIVLGQMIGSLLLDHYGVLQSHNPITTERVIGAVLIMAGTYLVVYR